MDYVGEGTARMGGWDLCLGSEHRAGAGGGGEDDGGSTLGQADSGCLWDVPVDVQTRLAHVGLGTIRVQGEGREHEASVWRRRS